MLIDWFTVAAQALNFLVLVWLLKRFLYQPILDAIDAREQHIAEALASAETQKTMAQQERDQFQQKNDQFDRQHKAMLQQVEVEVNTERQRLLQKARQTADAAMAKRQAALQQEQQNLGIELCRRTRDEVFAIARKTLTDLAGTSLEAQITQVLLERLADLQSEARETLVSAIASTDQPVHVRSTFALTKNQQAAIQHALDITFDTDVPVIFDTAAELISGIELSINGQKLAWSIAEYLTSLEKHLTELLAEQHPKNIISNKSRSLELSTTATINATEPRQ